MASMAMLTAVSKPNVESVAPRSLSIVLGTPTTGTPCSPSLVATPRVSSPPMATSASTPRPARLSLIRSMPLRPPAPVVFSGFVRDEPRIVPPRGRMPRTAWMSSGTVSPSSGPRHPSRNPTNSRPYSWTPLRTTARITAFKPGQSPPPVRTPTRMPTTLVGETPARMDEAWSTGKTQAGDRSGDVVIVLLVGLAPVCQLGLGPASVDVDVLLAGKLGYRLHDLVRHRAQQHGVGLAVVAGEVHRLTELDPWADPEVRPDRAGPLELERVDHRARDDRGAGLDGQPGHAGLAPVQAAVRAAGALGVDAEHVSGRQHLQAGPQRLLTRCSPGPVDRDLPDPGEERLADQALQPAPGEVLRLGQEDHLARHRQRPEEMVGEGQMVAGQDDRTPPRNVLDPPGPGPEHDLQQHPERVLRHPVAHLHIVPRRGAEPKQRGNGLAAGLTSVHAIFASRY